MLLKKTNQLRRLEGYGVTEKDYDRHEKMLEKRFGATPSTNDIVWSILSELSAKRKHIPMVYIDMARIASMEGKDTKPYIEKVNKSELRELRSIGIKEVKIIDCSWRNDDPHICDACKALFDKKLLLKDEIKNPQIPHVLCTSESRRCYYVPYYDDWLDRLHE